MCLWHEQLHDYLAQLQTCSEDEEEQYVAVSRAEKMLPGGLPGSIATCRVT